MTDIVKFPEHLRELCKELGVRPYQRLSSESVCEILSISEPTLNRLRAKSEIAYLRIGERGIGFFGIQVAELIWDSIEEAKPCPATIKKKDHTKSESTGSQNKAEARHGAARGMTGKPSKQDELASALRILKRPSKL